MTLPTSCPKPVKAPKKVRRGLPPSSHPIPRGGPIKPKKRTPSEFARIYGSKQRVQWIKAQPCLVCGMTPSENAHTEIDGMGRKAGFETIVPLCRVHHCCYDTRLAPFNDEDARITIRGLAIDIALRWRASGRDGE